MLYLKQSTAKTLRVGPFVDDTDGKTAETGLTISQADIRLSKSGGAFAQTNDASGATHDENGWYYLQLDATDTNTLGPLQLAIHESGALPVFMEFMVVTANWFDSMFSTDYLQVDVEQVDGDGTAAANLNSACDNYSAETGLAGSRLDAAVSSRSDGTGVTLHSDYDAAKTAAQAGDQMNLADDAITGAKFDESTAHPQTGDAFVRLGAPAGASIAEDVANVKSVVDNNEAIATKLDSMLEEVP